jgi:ethanolamine utilization protein EutP (predicted NTPase)
VVFSKAHEGIGAIMKDYLGQQVYNKDRVIYTNGTHNGLYPAVITTIMDKKVKILVFNPKHFYRNVPKFVTKTVDPKKLVIVTDLVEDRMFEELEKAL